ncbi:MAG: hypothetical protein LBT53_06695 [Puniceicoccales bacterium]|jgi:hypothetical protein|nr:hypothetical protein [Puniceicoccales bacterium]
MGMGYDGTPPAEWIGAKVYAEYAIMLVNTAIERSHSEDIPMPVAMAVQSNFRRAVEALPPEMKLPPEEITAYKERCGSWEKNLETFEKLMKDVFVPDPANRYQYTGIVPAKSILRVLYSLQDLFSSAYAAHFYQARVEWFTDCGDEEAGEDEFYNDVWREVFETASDHWHTNETHIYAVLNRDGPYAGHVTGYVGGGDNDGTVKTPTRIFKPKPVTPETPAPNSVP